jgi:hypothetical protein
MGEPSICQPNRIREHLLRLEQRKTEIRAPPPPMIDVGRIVARPAHQDARAGACEMTLYHQARSSRVQLVGDDDDRVPAARGSELADARGLGRGRFLRLEQEYRVAGDAHRDERAHLNVSDPGHVDPLRAQRSLAIVGKFARKHDEGRESFTVQIAGFGHARQPAAGKHDDDIGAFERVVMMEQMAERARAPHDRHCDDDNKKQRDGETGSAAAAGSNKRHRRARQHPGPVSGAGRGNKNLAFNQANITSPWALLRLLDLEFHALPFA